MARVNLIIKKGVNAIAALCQSKKFTKEPNGVIKKVICPFFE